MSARNNDMRYMIQDWMAQATDPVDLARIYSIILREADRQLDSVMKFLLENHEIRNDTGSDQTKA